MPDKAAVRAQAARLGLAVAAKPDSQDICFVPAGSYADMVAALRPDAAEPGDIVTRARRGARPARRHRPLHGRPGQAPRRRLRAPAASARRWWRWTPPRRRVIVGPPSSGARRLSLRDVNWLTAPPPEAPQLHVKLRARDTRRAAQVQATPAGADILLAAGSLACPGQACVFYEGARVLGGGFIRPQEAARAA